MIREKEPEEEDWLAIAHLVDWLDGEDDLEAIYFTAPPPNFALEQADWYVRPDLSSFLEEPVLLREACRRYPIPLEEIQRAFAERFWQFGNWVGHPSNKCSLWWSCLTSPKPNWLRMSGRACYLNWSARCRMPPSGPSAGLERVVQ